MKFSDHMVGPRSLEITYINGYQVKYGVIDLLTDVGSWAGLMLASYILLWWYQWVFKPFGNIDSYDARHASEVLLTTGDEQKAKRKREEFLKQAKEIERFIMTQAQEREREKLKAKAQKRGLTYEEMLKKEGATKNMAKIYDSDDEENFPYQENRIGIKLIE